MPAIGEIKRNGNTYGLGKTFVITEDMVSVSTDSTKGVAPYNESYGYTNITIDDTKGIVRMEGAVYVFVINTEMVVASAYRNVRIRIGTNGSRKPLMNAGNSIMAGSSYFTKARTDVYVYKKTNQSGGALHLNNDTSYSAMSVAEGKTATATNSRVMRADYLKQIIDYHVGQNTNFVKKTDSAQQTISATSGTTALGVKSANENSSYISYSGTSWLGSLGVRKVGNKVLPTLYDGTSHDIAYTEDIPDISGKQDTLTAGEGISIENNVISATSTSAGNMNCITDFGRTRRFGTKAMFNALTEKDVNGVYVILSQRDYNKMIQD